MVKRYAIVATRTPASVAAYMPANYEVIATFEPGELDDLAATMTEPGCVRGYGHVVIEGHDNAGWTLEGYVIPRLQSGNHASWEIDLSHPVMKRIPVGLDPDYDTDSALADLRRASDYLASLEGNDEAQGHAADVNAASDWFASGQFE